MKVSTVVAITGTFFLTGVQAIAMTPASQAMTNRHQVADCMTKQMAASRSISYNEASKLCKGRLQPRSESLASSNEAKPAKAR